MIFDNQHLLNSLNDAPDEKNTLIDITTTKRNTVVYNDNEERIAGEPRINVISKEEYEKRVEKVFHILWEVLAKSFGPYGAPTLICNYPWTHVTKDGYTIMKNLSMDTSNTLVDQQIADMAADICGRLNYSVGDGTTSAVIATNSIYQRYRSQKSLLEDYRILPRDVIRLYEILKQRIVNTLINNHVKKIDINDRDSLREIISNVVFISSNGDQQITDYISDLYYELGSPAITCSLAPDGVTRKNIISGYKFDMSLMDKIYINTDDNVLHLSSADFIIFSTKVREETYEKILKPLSEACRIRGRRLIVAATNYDETALKQTIRRDLNNEYSKTKKVNMVLTTYRATSDHARRLVEDFAVLVNTTVIDRSLEYAILNELKNVAAIENIFNLDTREGLPPITIGVTHSENSDKPKTIIAIMNSDDPKDPRVCPIEVVDNYIRVGYAQDIDIGLTSTVVRGLYYDKEKYDIVVKDAKTLMEETRKKYQKMGTFSLAVNQAEQRYYALNLKMGSIEVGADSELSQKLLKDSVDDSIKAAASAYYHGVISGDNTTLIRIIYDMIHDDYTVWSKEYKILLNILYHGFIDVYKTVLSNAFPDEIISYYGDDDPWNEKVVSVLNKLIPCSLEFVSKYGDAIKLDDEDAHKAFKMACEITAEDNTETDDNNATYCSIHNYIVMYSVVKGVVYDLSTKEFSSNIINSAQTDIEILKATIDLISILITGNQMVITQKHNFE